MEAGYRLMACYEACSIHPGLIVKLPGSIGAGFGRGAAFHRVSETRSDPPEWCSRCGDSVVTEQTREWLTLLALSTWEPGWEGLAAGIGG